MSLVFCHVLSAIAQNKGGFINGTRLIYPMEKMPCDF